MKERKKERGREKFQRNRNLLKILTIYYSIFPRTFRMKLLIFHRKTTGIFGIAIRYALLKTLVKSLGDNVSIQPDVYLLNVHNLEIGNNVSIHPMCYIEAFGNVCIGDDVSIAHGVTILSVSHEYGDISIPIKDQGILCRKTDISNNVWIGAKATILYGTKISEGSIIAANSVVNKDTEPFTINGGMPTKILKKRN